MEEALGTPVEMVGSGLDVVSATLIIMKEKGLDR